MTTPNLFAGATYAPLVDDPRLLTQLDRVKRLMLDGRWRTVDEIHAITHDPHASISAQLRNLRKAEHGSHVVERRLRGERTRALYEFRVLPRFVFDSEPL